MGFWHTGYMDFHEPTGLGAYSSAPITPVYQCDWCASTFKTEEALRSHRFEMHPAVRPALFIRGNSLGSGALRVSRPLAPNAIQVFEAASATINGVAVAPKNLPARLAKIDFGTTEVVLRRQDVEARFVLNFEIALPEHLAGVEQCFQTAAHRGRLDRRAIEDFIQASRPFDTAIAYIDGISEYFYGVLAKERHPDCALPYAMYRDKFNRAAEALRDVDRTLAYTIRALVAFHFNHFELARRQSPGTRIGLASSLFAATLNGTTDSSQSISPQRFDGSLTDRDTETILRWTVKPESDPIAQLDDMERVLAGDLAEFDRAKLHVLLADAYLAAGRHSAARPHAQEMRNSPGFEAWADRVLQPLTGSHS
jgi:hypothetical protein